SLEPSDMRHVTLPAIAHWNFCHFVVIERWSPRWVEIIDPAAGRRRIHATEFDAAFTGVIVMLEPGIGFLRRRAAGQISWLCYMRASLARISGLLVQIIAASVAL